MNRKINISKYILSLQLFPFINSLLLSLTSQPSVVITNGEAHSSFLTFRTVLNPHRKFFQFYKLSVQGNNFPTSVVFMLFRPPHITQCSLKQILNLEFPLNQVIQLDKSDSHVNLSLDFMISLLVTVQNSRRISVQPAVHILRNTFYLKNQSAYCKRQFLKI